MNTRPTVEKQAEPLPVELLASEDSRRLENSLESSRAVTVEDHLRFRESIIMRPPADPIDELVAELRALEAEGGGRHQ